MADLRYTLSSLTEVESSPQVHERVLAALAKRREQSTRPLFSFRPLFAGVRRAGMAGALASAVLALLIIQPWAERGQLPENEMLDRKTAPVLQTEKANTSEAPIAAVVSNAASGTTAPQH